MQSKEDDLLHGENAGFLSDLYNKYQQSPDTVDEKWQRVFRDMAPLGSSSTNEKSIIDFIRALMLIRAHRVRGHLAANLDPLGIEKRAEHPELNPASYGFCEGDYDRLIYLDNVLGFERATLRAILDRVRKTYCASIGVEFMHIQHPAQKAWIQERIENSIKPKIDSKKILTQLTQAEAFEKFLNTKFPGAKRFGLEGGESLIPGLEQVLEIYSRDGNKKFALACRTVDACVC